MKTDTENRLHEIRNSRIYQYMTTTNKYLDEYYLDGVIGLLPYGIGDIISALFSIIYVYVSASIIRSIPLTLAIINNILRDVILGMLPFFVGDVIDFFHRSNTQNMALINGFIDGDSTIINKITGIMTGAVNSFILVSKAYL